MAVSAGRVLPIAIDMAWSQNSLAIDTGPLPASSKQKALPCCRLGPDLAALCRFREPVLMAMASLRNHRSPNHGKRLLAPALGAYRNRLKTVCSRHGFGSLTLAPW